MRYLIIIVLLTCTILVHAQQKNIYYPSGLVQYSYQLKDGKLSGDYISYYENGFVKAKGSFTNGQKQGTWKAWDTSGMLRTQRDYRTNIDFELMNEWSNNGCAMSPGYLEKKKTEFKTPYSFHEGEPIYIHRYWETISPDETNNELFTGGFNIFLKEEIKAGRVTAFADDRFVSNLSPAEAAKLVNRIPDGFLLKTDHCFFASRQQMTVRIIGLGLEYKDAGGDKIAWLYYPDLRPVIYSSFSFITEKFANQLFSTKLDMTTYGSTNRKPVNVGENEKLTLLLAEIDFETGAWVYLLDKDLQHTKKN